MPAKDRVILTLIAASQFWGGVTGALLVWRLMIRLFAASGLRPTSGYEVLFVLAAAAFYFLTTLAAVSLLQGAKRGLDLSLVIQLPQLLQVVTAKAGFVALAGLYVTLHPFADAFGIRFGYHAAFSWNPTSIGAAPGVGVNLLAICVLAYLIRVKLAMGRRAETKLDLFPSGRERPG